MRNYPVFEALTYRRRDPKKGGHMKRFKLTIILLVLSTSTLFAQRGYRDGNNHSSTYRVDRQELHQFEEVLDQFSFAMITGNMRAARYAKHEILLDMEREINQTRRKLNMVRREYGLERYSKRESNWGNSHLESRGNGVSHYVRREVADMVHQLEKQERLYYRFSELRLESRRGQVTNEDEHRRIMYRFEETLREDLQSDDITQRSTTTRRGMH